MLIMEVPILNKKTNITTSVENTNKTQIITSTDDVLNISKKAWMPVKNLAVRSWLYTPDGDI